MGGAQLQFILSFIQTIKLFSFACFLEFHYFYFSFSPVTILQCITSPVLKMQSEVIKKKHK